MDSTSSPSTARSIHAICDDFESEWKQGHEPKIESYLERLPNERRRLLMELLLLECAYRRLRGEQPQPDHYTTRFPEETDVVGEAIETSRFTARSVEMLSSTTLGTVAVDCEPHDSPLPDALPVFPGMVVGKYRLVSRIGSGGMGTVFLAAHTMIDLSVALKVMQPSLLKRPAAHQRFLQEAQAAVRLQHKNIILTRDIGEDCGLLYLTMEILDGRNLSDHVKQQGPMPPEQVLSVLEQAADGLSYAHQNGVIHRDVKPHNLMILNDAAATVKILDLGLARFVDGGADASLDASLDDGATMKRKAVQIADDEVLTGTGSVMGTPGYMAPEQAHDSRTADARSDVFSLGCTGYYLLSGKPPFQVQQNDPHDGEFRNLGNAATAIERRKVIPLEAICPTAPLDLRRIIERMMAVDPARRYASMAELSAELRTVRRRHYFKGWVPSADDAEGLRRALLDLELIAPQTLEGTSARDRRTSMTEETADASCTEDAFELLRLLGRAGERGLSQFQIEQIMTGRIDRLRLPSHVVVDQLNNGWKGEVLKARRCGGKEPADPATTARSESGGRIEAVRVLKLDRLIGLGTTNAERAAEFLRRVERITAMPSHSSVARLYDGQLHGDVIVLASELVEGITLNKLVADLSPFTTEQSLPRLLDLMLEMCAALQHVHTADLLHLDQSPDRWIVADGRLVLLDSGLASFFVPQQSGAAPTGLGMPPVIAPEMTGRWTAASPAADVFALGHIFKFLRNGKFPFRSMRSAADADTPASRKSGTFAALPNMVRAGAKLDTTQACAPLEQIDRLLTAMTSASPEARPEMPAIVAELDELRQTVTRGGGWKSLWKNATNILFRRG